jgi:hypothetical protein
MALRALKPVRARKAVAAVSSRGCSDLPHWRRRRAELTIWARTGRRSAMMGFLSVFTVAITLLLIICGVALLPALLVIGAVVLVFSLVAGVIGFVFRLVGGLILLVVAVPLMLAACGLALAIGIGILHAALPLLLVIGVIWLIAHHHRAAPASLPNAQ